jgi:hypothetical protein
VSGRRDHVSAACGSSRFFFSLKFCHSSVHSSPPRKTSWLGHLPLSNLHKSHRGDSAGFFVGTCRRITFMSLTSESRERDDESHTQPPKAFSFKFFAKIGQNGNVACHRASQMSASVQILTRSVELCQYFEVRRCRIKTRRQFQCFSLVHRRVT